MRSPAAFLSYVHAADFDGRITALRERLEAEIRLAVGQPFAIFQDKEDIAWGQAWSERIEQVLDAATFFLPILTPGFFISKSCRAETERFLEREKALGRHDLILPIYYVDTLLLNERSRREGDELAEVLASRQWFDWRPLYTDSLDTPAARRAFATLAMSLRDALEGAATIPRASPSSGVLAASDVRVDPSGRGDFTRVADAVRGTRTGARIRIAPGLYREKLLIGTSRELVGEGDPADVVIAAPDDSTGESQAVVHWIADAGRIANLTIRGGTGPYDICVMIGSGRLDLEGCDLATTGGVVITTGDGADPRIRGNSIHGAATAGVILGGGFGVIEGNRIYDNLHGLVVTANSSHLVRGNRIFENRDTGIWVMNPSNVRFEANEILENATLGIAVTVAPAGVFADNSIVGHSNAGLAVSEKGGGIFRGNHFKDNDDAWRIDPDATARVTWQGNISE